MSNSGAILKRMDYAAYLEARDFVVAVGRPFTWLILIGATVQLALAVIPRRGLLEKAALWVGRGVFILLVVGFGILARYHFAIRQTTPILDPFEATELGRFALPLWIEGEKLFFWSLCLGLLAMLAYRKSDLGSFPRLLEGAWAILTITAILTGRPLADPLPRFDQEIQMYREVLLFADPQTQWRVTQMMYGRMVGFYNSAYMWIHPPILFLSYAALTPAFVASLAMAIRPENLWERLSYGYARFGYLLLTFGLLLGYPWTKAAWSNLPWWWDPKVNMSLMMWVLYTAYLHAHLYVNRQPLKRTVAILGTLSFLSLVLTYITTYVVPGLHSYVQGIK